jgi:hypothetical protein
VRLLVAGETIGMMLHSLVVRCCEFGYITSGSAHSAVFTTHPE